MYESSDIIIKHTYLSRKKNPSSSLFKYVTRNLLNHGMNLKTVSPILQHQRNISKPQEFQISTENS